MASEFTRKVQKIKDILKFNSVLADDGDVLLTKDGEVYTQVNGKVKQLSNPNYGKDNANKILSVSDTGDAVPIPMPTSDNILGKNNTFTGDNTFNRQINGSFKTRNATFTDFATVTSDMEKYAGLWVVDNKSVTGAPVGAKNYIVEVIPGSWSGNGVIFISSYTTEDVYVSRVDGGLKLWFKLSNDTKVLHNIGNETSSGDKTFNGQTTLLNGNFGLRVTNTGIVKTTDAGNTWVAL